MIPKWQTCRATCRVPRPVGLREQLASPKILADFRSHAEPFVAVVPGWAALDIALVLPSLALSSQPWPIVGHRAFDAEHTAVVVGDDQVEGPRFCHPTSQRLTHDRRGLDLTCPACVSKPSEHRRPAGGDECDPALLSWP